MTAKEMKIKTFSLIEEYVPSETSLVDDEDINYKINGAINSVMFELARIKKIPAKYTVKVTKKNNSILIKDITDIFQLNIIPDIQYEMIGDYELVFHLDDDVEEQVVNIYYYKYPEKMELEFTAEGSLTADEVSAEYDESFEFELDDSVLEIMPYGIAADLLKQDMISGYGKYFYERYMELKQSLDTRVTNGAFIIDGGCEV